MNSTSRSTIIGHHRRRATVVVWAGYCSGLVMATALGLSVFALATQHYVFGLYGLTATVALAGVVAAALAFGMHDKADPVDQALALCTPRCLLAGYREVVADTVAARCPTTSPIPV